MKKMHDTFCLAVLLTLLLAGCTFQRISGRSSDEFTQQNDNYTSRHFSTRSDQAGAPHRFEYGLMRQGEDYRGWLKIRTEQGAELWSDEWGMRASDLEELLATESGEQKDRMSKGKPHVTGAAPDGLDIKSWVQHIFSGELHYGVEIGEVKLKPGDLNSEYLAFYAKKLNTTPARLKDEILGQPRNQRIAYRATWREDYKELVFVPSLNQYIMYGSGQY